MRALISMRIAFLECAVVELVYKFDETSTANVEKVSRPLRCHSNVVFSFFGGGDGRTQR